jgi:integrase/recombinase XerC
MTAPTSPPSQVELDAALVLLARLGITPADLTQATVTTPPAPTFAQYIPVVSAAVGAGTRRVYSSYWNRIIDQWGSRRLDEPTPSRPCNANGTGSVPRLNHVPADPLSIIVG